MAAHTGAALLKSGNEAGAPVARLSDTRNVHKLAGRMPASPTAKMAVPHAAAWIFTGRLEIYVPIEAIKLRGVAAF